MGKIGRGTTPAIGGKRGKPGQSGARLQEGLQKEKQVGEEVHFGEERNKSGR